MKKKYDFCLSILLFLTVFLLCMNGVRRNNEALAARIAPGILRFHVLANSNAPEDQALKLQVKDFLLQTIAEELEHGTQAASDNPNGTLPKTTPLSREMVCQYITRSRSRLEQMAETYMEQQGFFYTAEIRLEPWEFPQKTYGDMTFPAGMYDAVRVILGEGQGENFWCVLYPSLCYMDSTHAVMPDSSKELLQTLIPEDDFQALLTARRQFRQPAEFSLGGKQTSAHSDGCSKDDRSRETETEQESLLPRIRIRFKLLDLFHNCR